MFTGHTPLNENSNFLKLINSLTTILYFKMLSFSIYKNIFIILTSTVQENFFFKDWAAIYVKLMKGQMSIELFVKLEVFVCLCKRKQYVKNMNTMEILCCLCKYSNKNRKLIFRERDTAAALSVNMFLIKDCKTKHKELFFYHFCMFHAVFHSKIWTPEVQTTPAKI